MRLLTAFALFLIPVAASFAQRGARATLSLNGDWEIEESTAAEPAPQAFAHRVPVPGLANLATPAFPDVDRFDSRELIGNLIRKKQLPESAKTEAVGVSRQNRNYFWYRKTFRPAQRRTVAVLKVSKAQFGTAVWLNGRQIGEHQGCFTAGYFDLTRDIHWDQENALIIRVGAHPAVLPPSVPAGTDFEKLKWAPGIYDSVSVAFSDGPSVETLQVAPRINSSQIVVQVRLKNRSGKPATVAMEYRVREWKGGRAAAKAAGKRVALAAGEEKVVEDTVPIPGARLWTPEDPFLYELQASSGGDSYTTRFGMREFRFDTPTRRAYLNGKPYFLRGSNITLHRFFEDPLAKHLPWDEKWVRRLLVELPKQMHWNSFRFCIGPVPDFWLDIADEAGLLIQHEYFIWTGGDNWHKEWDASTLIRELGEWVRDSWNHPSIALWDACNETVADVLNMKVVPEVRKLDLSNRPWEVGYNLPSGPDDPYEDHPYLFSRLPPGRTPQFRITDLERMAHYKQSAAAHPSAHASILNEYGWIWLNRDGSPTLLTKDVWDTILGPGATGAQRLKHWAYLLAGLTEYWRAGRYHAGVLHFVYLTCSYPGVFTSDHWRDVEKLELDPDFADYVGEAFKPLGVYLNFWQPELRAGARQRFLVSMVNDLDGPVQGKLTLSIATTGGRQTVQADVPFDVAALGQQSYAVTLALPDAPGDYEVRAAAVPDKGPAKSPTVSRRLTRIMR